MSSKCEGALSISYNKKGQDELARRLDLATLPILALGFVAVVASIMVVAW